MEEATKQVIGKVVKATASGVPYIGGFAVEAIASYCGPNAMEWREACLKNIINELDINPNRDTVPDSFVTTIAMLIPHIDRTRVNDKIQAYKNIAIFSHKNPSIEEYKVQQVIRTIDQISEQHLYVLERLSQINPNTNVGDYLSPSAYETIKNVNQISFDDFMKRFIGGEFNTEWLEIIVNDLKNYNLVRISKVWGDVGYDGLTTLGNDIIRMIKE